MTTEGRLAKLQSMLKDEPGDTFLNYALALEYLKMDQSAHAENQLKMVLTLDPDYVPAYYQLGQLFQRHNDTQQALHYYHQGRSRALAKKDRKAAGEFEEAIFLLED